MNEEDITPKKINDSAETTQEGLNQILLGRNIDRVIAYIQMKMNTAISVNSELSGIRTQIIQMGWFLSVALVLGTGGLNSFFEWNQTALVISVSVTLIVAIFSYSSIRTLTEYTDLIMEEHHAFEALYSTIVWDGFGDLVSIAKQVSEIENNTKIKVDAMNRKHRLLTGTILHSMIHFESQPIIVDD